MPPPPGRARPRRWLLGAALFTLVAIVCGRRLRAGLRSDRPGRERARRPPAVARRRPRPRTARWPPSSPRCACPVCSSPPWSGRCWRPPAAPTRRRSATRSPIPYLLGVAAGAGLGVTLVFTDTGGVLGAAERRRDRRRLRRRPRRRRTRLRARGRRPTGSLDRVADPRRRRRRRAVLGACRRSCSSATTRRSATSTPGCSAGSTSPAGTRCACSPRTPPCRIAVLVGAGRRLDVLSRRRRRGRGARDRSRRGPPHRRPRRHARHRGRRLGQRADRLRRHHRAPRRPPARRAQLPPHPPALGASSAAAFLCLADLVARTVLAPGRDPDRRRHRDRRRPVLPRRAAHEPGGEP